MESGVKVPNKIFRAHCPLCGSKDKWHVYQSQYGVGYRCEYITSKAQMCGYVHWTMLAHHDGVTNSSLQAGSSFPQSVVTENPNGVEKRARVRVLVLALLQSRWSQPTKDCVVPLYWTPKNFVEMALEMDDSIESIGEPKDAP